MLDYVASKTHQIYILADKQKLDVRLFSLENSSNIIRMKINSYIKPAKCNFGENFKKNNLLIRNIILRLPKIRIHCKPPFKVLVPVMKDRQRDISFSWIAYHLCLRNCKTGGKVHKVLQHLLTILLKL